MYSSIFWFQIEEGYETEASERSSQFTLNGINMQNWPSQFTTIFEMNGEKTSVRVTEFLLKH